MNTRSAHATIKGYFYQFDHTIVQILSATTPASSVVVEGIEDIDLVDGGNETQIQCKYYEGTKYNHSVIKDAIIQMLRHFHKNGCQAVQGFQYRLYGHYESNQHTLPANFNLDFLKENFLTYTSEKKVHKVYDELTMTDAQLTIFQGLLKLDVLAKSYDNQQQHIGKLLISQISGCTQEDADIFYYPNAINAIQKLAIQSDAKDRKITKAKFLLAVNRKDVIFSLWLHQKFGDGYYARVIKKKYFKYPSTKVPKASRIFVLDATDEFDVAKITTLLSKIGTRYSHVELTRTPPQDRFCPYVLLRGIEPKELVVLKGSLFSQGIKLIDGHAFDGSTFSPSCLAVVPMKDYLIKLKFISLPQQVASVISAISDSVIEVFEFFKSVPSSEFHVPSNIPHHKIKIDSVHFINEVI